MTMPGGDPGDDFAEGTLQKCEQVAYQLMMMRHMRGPKEHGAHEPLGLMASAREAMRELTERYDALFTGAAGEGDDMKDGLQDRLDGKEAAYAVGEDGAQYFSEQLEAQGLGYELRMDGRSGLWRFAVDAEELAARPAEFREYFKSHSLEGVNQGLAVEAACAQAASKLAAEGGTPWPGVLESGNPDNKRFSFKTVSWDADASIMKNRLSDLGVPYVATPAGSGLVAFEIPGEAAPAVEELANLMCKQIRGVYPERFGFPEGFSQLAFDEVYRCEVGAEEARMLEELFQQHGVEYTAFREGAEGPVELTVKVPDRASAKALFDQVSGGDMDIVDAATAREAQRQYEAAKSDVRDQARPRARKAQRNTSEKDRAERAKRTPAKDERRMREQARAQSRGRAPKRAPKRTPKVTRGLL